MRYSVPTHAFMWLFAAAFVTMAMAAPGNAFQLNTPDRGALEIRLTGGGIEPGMAKPGQPGLYHVTIINDSHERRGIVMKGIDKGPSPFVRYTTVLEPGQRETFRWYFPGNRTVRVRDLMACGHRQRSCMAASFGEWHGTLQFAG
jgi:hypothetical protein